MHSAFAEVPSTPIVGNRCGHRPDSPQWDKIISPEMRGSLPPILIEMMENAMGYYYDPMTLIPLSKVMNGKEKGKGTQERGMNKDGSMRKGRSEAREAEVLVMIAILTHMDVVSLRIGTPIRGNGFIHRSCHDLAARVSLLDPKTNRPSRRFQRAFRRLQDAGLLNVTRVATKSEDGKITQSSAVKNITEDFAVLLLGGTAADRARLKRQRDNQSKKQAPNRAPLPSQAKEQERAALGAKIYDDHRAGKAAKEISTDTGFKVSPEEYRAAYAAAKDARAAELRAQGLHFKDLMAELAKFPAMGDWKP